MWGRILKINVGVIEIDFFINRRVVMRKVIEFLVEVLF